MIIATDQRAAIGIPLAEVSAPGPLRSRPVEEPGFGAAFAVLAAQNPNSAEEKLETSAKPGGHGAGDAPGNWARARGDEAPNNPTDPSDESVELDALSAIAEIALQSSALGVASPGAAATAAGEPGRLGVSEHALIVPANAQVEPARGGFVEPTAEKQAGPAEEPQRMPAPIALGAFNAAMPPA